MSEPQIAFYETDVAYVVAPDSLPKLSTLQSFDALRAGVQEDPNYAALVAGHVGEALRGIVTGDDFVAARSAVMKHLFGIEQPSFPPHPCVMVFDRSWRDRLDALQQADRAAA